MTEENCKQYIKSDGLNFCMSSVCPEKDCIYALVNKLHQTIDHLEQENKELKEKFKQVFNIDNQECWNIAFLNDEKCKYRSALEEIRILATLQHIV
jgi:hypothetical protein